MDDTIMIEECITRLDAIRHEIVQNSRDHFALSAGIAALYEMENGHAVNRWIPCSERLPEYGEEVLVWFEYFRYGKYNRLYQTHGIGEFFGKHGKRESWLINHETGWQKLKVFAWMPLPEPPESEVRYDWNGMQTRN